MRACSDIYARMIEELLKAQKKVAFGHSPEKIELHRHAESFIAHSWAAMKPALTVAPWFGLVSPIELSALPEYLAEMKGRSSAFPWAWFRARATEALSSRLDEILPDMKRAHSEQFAAYEKSLRSAGRYWFRQSVRQHLQAGYHTALSAIWMALGEHHAALAEQGLTWDKEDSARTKKALKTLASFHLDYLIAADNVLWNSAGATEFPWKAREGFGEATVGKVLSNFADKQPGADQDRLGCPALRAKVGSITVFEEVWLWCEAVFLNLYIPALEGRDVRQPDHETLGYGGI